VEEAIIDPFPPTTLLYGSAGLLTPFHEGKTTKVYIDPPYQGSTGFRGKNTMPRDLVTNLGTAWYQNGHAQVGISEAEPLPIPDWSAVDVTALRRGNKRTWSRQKAEYLTLSPTTSWGGK